MLWRDVIELLTPVSSRNSYGETIETYPNQKQVFANKKSVRQSEFYQAAAVGLRPEMVFEIQVIEYEEQPKVRYGDTVYHVVRTFSKNGEVLELVCSRYPMEGGNG
ncbi:phage head closure protein [Paenibacillus thailandensis]|uniref:Phage head closure protein n=1 Tax=Paenibacillus thailandensis TaxID=393250 RepID=A0ABW5QSZ5_9BACL